MATNKKTHFPPATCFPGHDAHNGIHVWLHAGDGEVLTELRPQHDGGGSGFCNNVMRCVWVRVRVWAGRIPCLASSNHVWLMCTVWYTLP